MNKIVAKFLLLAVVFASGCAGNKGSGVNILETMKTQRVGVIGYPAAKLSSMHKINAIDVDKPTATDPASIQAFLREKMIGSLIKIEISAEETGVRTSSVAGEAALWTAVLAARILLSAAGGGVGGGSGASQTGFSGTSTTTPPTTYITCAMSIYLPDGESHDLWSSKYTYTGKEKQCEERSADVFSRMFKERKVAATP